MRINEIHGKDMYKERNIKEYNFDSFQTILDKTSTTLPIT